MGLVEVVGLWYRCCVVSRRGQHYRVFLLDEGCTMVTSLQSLSQEILCLSDTMCHAYSVCLAQYSEDENWYRALITSETPSAEKVEVLYVDYGNREQVSLTNLDACDILLLPMQAIKCSLADISNVPKEATTWFKQAVLERQLKAIVVAK
uniref:Tudor domain containing 6 n=1 Tax=Strix occidentalis caurina TaxID=311401 RepID=A0A8D0KWU3_STROC